MAKIDPAKVGLTYQQQPDVTEREIEVAGIILVSAALDDLTKEIRRLIWFMERKAEIKVEEKRWWQR